METLRTKKVLRRAAAERKRERARERNLIYAKIRIGKKPAKLSSENAGRNLRRQSLFLETD